LTSISVMSLFPSLKSTIRTRYNEHFAAWAGLALAMLLIDRLLVGGPLNRLP